MSSTKPGAVLDELSKLLEAADKRNGLPVGTMKSVMQQEIGGQRKYLDDPSAYHYAANAEGKRIAGHTGKISTAFGPFGILESTGARPGYGVEPLKDKSLPEQVRFASDYLAARSRSAGSLTAGLAGYGEGTKYASQVAGRLPGGDTQSVSNGPVGRRPDGSVEYAASAPAPVSPVAPVQVAMAPPAEAGAEARAVPLPSELVAYLASRGKGPAAPAPAANNAWLSFLDSMRVAKAGGAVAPRQPVQAQDIDYGGVLAAVPAPQTLAAAPMGPGRVDFSAFTGFGGFGRGSA